MLVDLALDLDLVREQMKNVWTIFFTHSYKKIAKYQNNFVKTQIKSVGNMKVRGYKKMNLSLAFNLIFTKK